MIRVNNKMLKQFMQIMEDYNEFLFGSKEQIKKQLELCLNTQGYWSGNSIKVFYDIEGKDFYITQRF